MDKRIFAADERPDDVGWLLPSISVGFDNGQPLERPNALVRDTCKADNKENS